VRTLDLGHLLGDKHPDASFHDSELEFLGLDFASGTADFRFQIPVGLIGNEYVYRTGTLRFTGLLFLAAESPNAPIAEWSGVPLWITDGGPFPDDNVRTKLALPPDLPDTAYCYYFYASNTNSFIVVAASEAFFSWSVAADTDKGLNEDNT
jgi:hypothetical protein